MAGRPQMVCLADFEKYALETLPRNASDYYRSGADGEVTLEDNIKAFSRWRLLPRVLRGVADRSTATSILGQPISFPVCVAPTAMHKMAHSEGEVATARAAGSMRIGYTLSTIATSSMEDIATGAPDCLRFFQLYIYRERSITLQLIQRAEAAGFKALLLTADTPFLGKRRADNRNRFKLPPHLRMANFDALDFKSSGVGQSKTQSGLSEYSTSLFDASLTWKDVQWLKSVTKLPIVIKGIMTAEDGRLAAEAGVAGVIVSNHGARQLDTVPATIDVLRSVVRAVAGRCEVYLDGGVRCGTDVIKALALGAKAVFIGRSAVYGLAYDGEEGVRQVLQILKDEFDAALALAGCSSVSDVDSSLVVHETQLYSKL